MQRRIGMGLVAGLIAGIAFTLVALFLKTTMPDGEQTSRLVVAAEALHSHGWVAGWIASLIYTVIIGGIFCWLVKAEPPHEPRLMVSAAVDAMRPVALASLIEHLLYGVILGFYALLTAFVDRRHGTHAVTHHAA